MTENNRNGVAEQEISLVDLMVSILLHWRSVLIAMIIGGVVFAGVSYVKSTRSAAAQQAQMEQTEDTQSEGEKQEEEQQLLADVFGGEVDPSDIDAEWLEEHLTLTQVNNVNLAISYEKLYDQKMEYKEKSLAMQMDPYHVPREEITFRVSSDDLENTYNIVKAYEDIASGVGLLDYLRETCGLDDNVSEMLSLERSSYDQTEGTDLVRLSVVHYDADICKKAADGVVDYLKKQSAGLKKKLGAHDLTLLDRSFGEVFVRSYLDEQKTFELDITEYRKQAASFKALFSDGEWIYYNFLVNGELTGNPDAGKLDAEGNVIGGETTEAVATGPAVQPGVSVKYVLLGMVVFAFIYVFVIFMLYVLNNKIRETDNFQELFRVAQLGFIPAEKTEQKPFGFVDRWILSLRNRNRRRFTPEEAEGLAAVAVKMSVEQNGLDAVYLVGCNLHGQARALCERIKRQLAGDKIRAEILDNVLYDAQAMGNLENARGVVLVETAGSTLYDEILQELELFDRQQIKVLGGIIVENAAHPDSKKQ